MLILFLAVHVLGFTAYNLLLRKLLTDKIDSFKLATVMQTGLTLPLLFTVFFWPPHMHTFDLEQWLLALGILVLTIGIHVTNTQSLKYLEASVYSVLYNLRIVIATILGIVFLNEDINWMRIMGGLLILLAILIVKQKGSRSILSKGFEWGLSAAVVISFLNLFEKELISEAGFFSYAVPVWTLTTLIMWSYLWYRDRSLDYKILVDPKMLKLMAARSISAYSFILAFTYGGLLSVSTYVSSMSVILIVVLGVLLLNERDYLMRKVIATAVAVLGLTVILLSSLL